MTATLTKVQKTLLYACVGLLVLMLGGIGAIFLYQRDQGSVISRVDEAVAAVASQNNTSTCRAGISAEFNIADARSTRTFLIGIRDGFEDGELSAELQADIDEQIAEQDRVIALYEELFERCPPPEEPDEG